MKSLELNKNQIYDFQQNREPYLMIDYATEIFPGQSSKGYKDFFNDEWFFKVHWPKDPNVPGMLQIESLVQMCALSILTLPGNKGKVLYLVSANKLQFKKKIIPNSRLELNTKIKSFNRGLALCEGEGFVDKEKACSAEFTLILPEIIKSYNIK